MTQKMQHHIAFTAPPLPTHYVNRPREFEAIAQLLLEGTSSPIAITTALQGGSGFGKTTLALALCYDERIRRAYPGGVLWIVVGEKPDLTSLLVEQIKLLTDEPIVVGDINAARARLRDLLADRRMLIVLDDIWQFDHAHQFLDGGPHCARLITTRRQDVVARLRARQPVEVNEMQTDEAASLLVKWLDTQPADMEPFRQMARELGEWPLLLELAGGYLREAVTIDKQSPESAVTDMRVRLRTRGFITFDHADEGQRNSAIAISLDVSLDRLGPHHDRFCELAVFPEDVDIPFVTIFRLWKETAGLSEAVAEDTLKTIQRLSLFTHYDPLRKVVRLHDVIRALLQTKRHDMHRLHGHLLDAHKRLQPADDNSTWGPGWAGLSQDEPYLWDHLIYHLSEATRKDDLVTTVKDLRYLVAKMQARNVFAAEADLTMAVGSVSSDTDLDLLARHFINIVHLLGRSSAPNEIGITLYSRLMHLPEFRSACQLLEQRISRPLFVPWRVLPDLPDPCLVRTFSGHTKEVTGCAVSPDNKWIVSASWDRTLKVWDIATGMERCTLRGHTGRVMDCAMSPNGQWIVSASADHTLKIWDPFAGVVRRTLNGHDGGVSACAISPNGEWIVSASWDHTLKIWEVSTGRVLHTLKGHTHHVTSCAFGPDGKWVVSASGDRTVKIWDAATGMELHTLKGHAQGVAACAVSHDGKQIVSASNDGTVRIWELDNRISSRILRGHSAWVQSCAISPNGQWIISASLDNTLKVWPLKYGPNGNTAQLEHRTLRGHTDRVGDCVVSPNNQWIVSASDDNTLKMWSLAATSFEMEMDAIKIDVPNRHRAEVRACVVSIDGRWAITASADNTLKVWNVATGIVHKTLVGHRRDVTDCALSSTRKQVVSASLDNTVKIWDIATGREILTLEGHIAPVRACVLSPDGHWIVSASDDHTLKVWDSTSGAELATLEGHQGEVTDCAVSADGKLVISVSSDGTLRAWDATNGTKRFVLQGHKGKISSCAISSDGNWIVSASRDRPPPIWNLSKRVEYRTLEGHTNAVTSCAISPDGRWIISTSNDCTLRLWDLALGDNVVTFHTEGPLSDCAWHPKGEHVIAVGALGVYWLKLVT
jgi:WD40 repeat protein